MGLDVYVSYPDLAGEQKSDKYPEHMCNKSYLRSSYNEGGFNSVVGKLIGKDLYHIFGLDWGGIEDAPGYVPWNEETEEGGHWIPTPEHLVKCKERAEEVVAELAAIERPLATMHVTSYPEADPLTAEQAIELTYKKLAERKAAIEKDGDKAKFWGGSYSSREGFFCLDDPLAIIAIVTGKDVLGSPCVHVVHDNKGFDHYTQMAEIVVEMIDTMLVHPGASVVWSG